MAWEHDLHSIMSIIDANRHGTLVKASSLIAFHECQKLLALQSFCSLY